MIVPDNPTHPQAINGMKFSTKDVNNDNHTRYVCSERYMGAWWFNRCYYGFLNGPNYGDGVEREYYGIVWYLDFRFEPIKSARMSIRPTNF